MTTCCFQKPNGIEAPLHDEILITFRGVGITGEGHLTMSSLLIQTTGYSKTWYGLGQMSMMVKRRHMQHEHFDLAILVRSVRMQHTYRKYIDRRRKFWKVPSSIQGRFWKGPSRIFLSLSMYCLYACYMHTLLIKIARSKSRVVCASFLPSFSDYPNPYRH